MHRSNKRKSKQAIERQCYTLVAGDLVTVAERRGGVVAVTLALHVLVHVLLVGVGPAVARRSGEDLCAVGQGVDVVDAEEGEADVLASVALVPESVAPALVGVEGKDVLGARVLGQVDVGGELEDTRGGVGVQSLAVEENVPDTGGAVLGPEGLVGVGIALLGGGVGADEGDKALRRDGLVLKERDELVGRPRVDGHGVDGGFGRGVLAANKGADAGAERADNGSNIGTHLDQIGHGDAKVLVLVEPDAGLVADLLETLVDGAHLAFAKGDNGAVSTTGVELLGVCAGIVEAEADSAAGEAVAAASSAGHGLLHLIGNVLPDAAGVLGTLGSALGGARVVVGNGVLGPAVAVAVEDELDGLADRGHVLVGHVVEITNDIDGLARVDVVVLRHLVFHLPGPAIVLATAAGGGRRGGR